MTKKTKKTPRISDLELAKSNLEDAKNYLDQLQGQMPEKLRFTILLTWDAVNKVIKHLEGKDA